MFIDNADIETEKIKKIFKSAGFFIEPIRFSKSPGFDINCIWQLTNISIKVDLIANKISKVNVLKTHSPFC